VTGQQRRLVWSILRSSGTLSSRFWLLVGGYYLLTPLNAFIDGAAWLLLIRLFAVAGPAAPAPAFVERLLSALRVSEDGLLGAVTAFFFAKALFALLLTALETRIAVHIRRSVQKAGLARIIGGRWQDLRGEAVGRWVGALTEESALFTKLLTSALNALYTSLTAGLLGLMALAVEPRLTLTLALVGVPAWLSLKLLYAAQTRLSMRQTEARQAFTADLTETLTALFQVKVSGEGPSALARGLRRQDEIMRREVQLGYTFGVLNSVNPLMLGVVLLAYGLYANWDAASLASGMATFGSVGILGFRAASQLSVLVGSLGNLTRISGSVEPIRRLLFLEQDAQRKPLPEPMSAIRLDGVSYSYGARRVISGRSARVEKGRLFLLTGPSGSGKTTLVNLIAGLHPPDTGAVLYAGASGTEYAATEYRPSLGYVPQEVHVFSGSIRENLDPLGSRDDAALWRALEQAGAAGFVKERGGLEATVTESGRSLSGGERRRVGIARALLSEPDGLILDEITNGLDEEAKAGLMRTVAELSRSRLVLAISHDRPAFDAASPVCLELSA
jgi:ABC-type multidrug transport system fused ATPase/permease subunit